MNYLLLAEHGGRTVRVRALPIGIPFQMFEEMANNAPTSLNKNQKCILGKVSHHGVKSFRPFCA